MLVVAAEVRQEDKIMDNYVVSGKKYNANSEEELLNIIKNQNANTKDLSLQEYMDDIAGNVINSMTRNKIEIPAKAEDIVGVWEKMGILEKKGNKFQEKVGNSQNSHKERFRHIDDQKGRY